MRPPGGLTKGTQCANLWALKALRWDQEKNEWLQANRGVSFEWAALKIAANDIVILIEHPNRARYPHQSMYVLELNGYAQVVPFVETEDEIFLKTIIPSRQATKLYLRGKHGKAH